MIDISKKLLLKVSNIAIEAGIEIMKNYSDETKILIKEDKSPLTQADLSANKIIIEKLNSIENTIPILSEESLVKWSERKSWKKYWLVDPLDGTKEFIKRNGEFTVNIALINNNISVLGVIFAPFFSQLYYASKGSGSYKLFSKEKIITLENSIKIKTKTQNKYDTIKIYGSRSHSNNNFSDWLNNNFKNYDLIKKGSSIKFCELAEGSADLYPRFGPTSEWDIAAGDIILTEAGGKLESFEGKKIYYNLTESVINPPFIASSKYLNVRKL